MGDSSFTPDFAALFQKARDSQVADAVLRGRCAAPSVSAYHVCQLPHGHDGPHGCGNWMWEARHVEG